MQHLKSLNKYFLKYRGRLIAGIVFVVVGNLLNIFPAQLTRKAIDFVLQGKFFYEMASPNLQQHQFIYKAIIIMVAWIGILILLTVLVRGVFLFLMRQTIIVMSRHIEFDQKNEIYNHYQQLDAGFYSRNSTGDLMNRISEDVSRVRMYTGPAIMYTINIGVMFIMVMWAMISISPMLTLYVAMPLPLMVLLIYFIQDKINRKSEMVQRQLSNVATMVQETFSGIRIVKSFARENLFHQLFDEKTTGYKKQSLELARINSLFFPSIMFLIGISTISTIYFGGIMVNQNEITYGNIAEFVIYVNLLTWPIGMLGWVITLIQRADASQKRILEFLETKPNITSSINAVSKKIEGEIKFENVDFSYETTREKILSGLSFSVKPGEIIAIIGETGSGKSTIANLLVRMYDTGAGKIKIDGTDLKQWDIHSLRKQTGYVPQDVVLFSDTIYNNIAFGLKNETNENGIENVEHAARQAMVHNDVASFKNGYKTVIGERGVTLSGGQKQRISIARALIKKPRLLIFDDCFSAVDTHTEEGMLDNLFSKSERVTAIILGHRITTMKYASRILVLHKGKIVEEGNHESLVQNKGFYAAMYEAQLAEDRKN